MNKIVSKKKTSAIFLAIVLLTGTITLFSPSFMVGAQVDSYYGQDNNYDKKSYGKNVSVKSIKCNNINVNVNGLELDILPPSLSTLLTNGETDDDVYSYGSGNGNYGSKSSGLDNDFRFICINNNNNTVIGGGNDSTSIPPIPPTPPVDECLLCFEETTQSVRDAVIAALQAEGPLVIVPGEYEVPASVTTIEGLCKWLTENAPLELTETQINNLISQFLRANPTLDREEVQELVECLIDADLIDVITCDDCFARLDTNIQTAINTLLAAPGPIPLPAGIGGEIPATVTNIAQLCLFLNADPIQITNTQISLLVQAFVALIGPGSDNIATALVNCLIEVGVITIATPELTASNINTDTSAFDINTEGGLTPSFSSPPTIAQGTEEDLSAMEKMTKLKTQWLSLLP